MTPTTSLSDCRRLVDAVQEAGGRVPGVLTNLLAGAALLAAQGTTTDPAKAIVAAALSGQLTEKRLDAMLLDYATATAANAYRGELRQRSERLFCQAVHKALADGAADQLLDSLRPQFDKAAAAIVAARDAIPPDTPAEQFLRTAKPAAISCWQQLDSHLAIVNAIGVLAAQFGSHTGLFPQITEFALGENFRLDDRAIWATDGQLESDSAVFGRPDQGHRTSPWFRLPLKLHSMASAQARYDGWAAVEFDRIHSGPQGGWIDEHGEMHEHRGPKTPIGQRNSRRGKPWQHRQRLHPALAAVGLLASQPATTAGWCVLTAMEGCPAARSSAHSGGVVAHRRRLFHQGREVARAQ